MEPEVRSEVMTITPEIAEKYLARNPKNRPIKQRKVDQYALAMAEGRWLLTGEPIIFDWDHNLQTGQHRFLACIKAGVPFQTVVMFGVDPAAKIATDSGQPWIMSDHLSVRGETNARELQRATIWVWRYMNDDLKASIKTPTTDILVRFLDLHPGIRESLEVGRRVQRNAFLSQPVASGSWYIASGLDREDADYFYSKLISGTELSEGSPILALRNWLLTTRARRHFRAQQRVLSMVTIKAWNYYREGKDIKRMYDPGPRAKMPEML